MIWSNRLALINSFVTNQSSANGQNRLNGQIVGKLLFGDPASRDVPHLMEWGRQRFDRFYPSETFGREEFHGGQTVFEKRPGCRSARSSPE